MNSHYHQQVAQSREATRSNWPPFAESTSDMHYNSANCHCLSQGKTWGQILNWKSCLEWLGSRPLWTAVNHINVLAKDETVWQTHSARWNTDHAPMEQALLHSWKIVWDVSTLQKCTQHMWCKVTANSRAWHAFERHMQDFIDSTCDAAFRALKTMRPRQWDAGLYKPQNAEPAAA